MPSKAVWTQLEIYNVLKNFKIFHDNGQIKTEVFKDETGNLVWNDAAKALSPMKRHNLYCYTISKSGKIVRKWLKAYHFPKADEVISKEVEDVKSQNFEVSYYEKSEVEDDNVKEKNEEIVKEDEYLALHEMKYSLHFSDIILRICITPFHLMYSSVQQTNICKDILKNTDYSICVTFLKDILPSIKLKTYTSNDNSIVAITGIVFGEPTFLAHMIPESLDEEFVLLFIKDFFKKITKLPSEISVGYHKTTVEEVCTGLNTCSFSEHNTQCLLYLQKKSQRLPKVSISVDLVDLLISVSQSPEFYIKSDNIQKNLIKFLIYLKFVPSIEEFRITVEEILLLIFSPFESEASIKTADILERKIESPTICEWYTEYMNIKNDEKLYNHAFMSDVAECIASKVVFQYIEAMKPKLDINLCKDGTPNSYYSETWYKTKLVFVLTAFPLWTCLLNESRDVHLIKNVSQTQVDGIIGLQPKASIHDFLERHIIQCDGQVDRRRAFLNQKKFQKSKNKHAKKIERLDQNLLYLNDEENWGGLNECYKEKDLLAESKCEQSELISELPNFLPKNDNTPDSINLNSPDVSKENVSPNEIANTSLPVESSLFENRSLLAGSMFPKSDCNDSSSIFHTSISTIGPPYKNSTLSREVNINLSSVLQNTEDSTAALLNNNIGFYNKDVEHLIDYESTTEIDSSINLVTVSSPEPKKKVEERVPLAPESKKEEEKGPVLPQPKKEEEKGPALPQLKREEEKVPSLKRKRNKPAVDIKKKKYKSACPDMAVRHQQVTSSKSSIKYHLISNGNGQEPISINSMKYYLDNTTTFDVLAEIFSFSYRNCSSFRNYCDSFVGDNCSMVCLLKVIKKFSQKNSINDLYTDRAILLHGCAHVNEDLSKISINNELDSFFIAVMFEHPSYKINNSCQHCSSVTSYENFVISVNADLHPISELEEYIVKLFIENLSINDNCIICGQQGSLTVGMGNYLAISINQGKVFDFVDSAPLYVTLINECKYMLVGVVTYVSDKNPLYVAFCRRPTGGWEMYNDKLKKVVYCKNLYEENIVFIIYVKV